MEDFGNFQNHFTVEQHEQYSTEIGAIENEQYKWLSLVYVLKLRLLLSNPELQDGCDTLLTLLTMEGGFSLENFVPNLTETLSSLEPIEKEEIRKETHNLISDEKQADAFFGEQLSMQEEYVKNWGENLHPEKPIPPNVITQFFSQVHPNTHPPSLRPIQQVQHITLEKRRREIRKEINISEVTSMEVEFDRDTFSFIIIDLCLKALEHVHEDFKTNKERVTAFINQKLNFIGYIGQSDSFSYEEMDITSEDGELILSVEAVLSKACIQAARDFFNTLMHSSYLISRNYSACYKNCSTEINDFLNAIRGSEEAKDHAYNVLSNLVTRPTSHKYEEIEVDEDEDEEDDDDEFFGYYYN